MKKRIMSIVVVCMLLVSALAVYAGTSRTSVMLYTTEDGGNRADCWLNGSTSATSISAECEIIIGSPMVTLDLVVYQSPENPILVRPAGARSNG